MTQPHNPFSAHRILPGTIPYLFSHEDNSTDLGQLDRLIDSWQANGYLGQIVGPHGCGKTTLAHAIANRTLESGNHPFDFVASPIIRSRSMIRPESAPSWLARLLRFHSTRVTFGASSCSDGGAATSCLDVNLTPNLNPKHERGNPSPSLTRRVEQSGSNMLPKTILVIDGIERLTFMQQTLTLHSLKRRQIPTLLTTHRISKRLPLAGVRCPVLFRAASDIRVFTKIVNLMTGGCERIEPAVIEATFKSSGGNVREALMALYDVFDSNNSSRPAIR